MFSLLSVPSKPPQFVEVKVLSSQSISVTWKRPHHDSIHGQLRGYKIRFYRVSDPDKAQEVRVGSKILNETLKKLGKFTTYKISVLAFTSKGDGVSSNEIKITTAEDSKLTLCYFIDETSLGIEIEEKKEWKIQRKMIKQSNE